jgi:TatD DNase family protein
MFIDAHCHLSFPDFDADRNEVLQRLQAANVSLLIDPGTDVTTSKNSIALAQEVDCVYANVGLHPHEATQPIGDDIFAQLEVLARQPKVVGLGEIGLDYHYPDCNKEAQQAAFREMLRIAIRLDLPVVIHSRDAWDDTLHMLDEEQHSALRGIMHCFSGDIAIANESLRRGFKLSIPGTLTYKKSLLPEVVAAVSMDDLLTETDAPYLAPVPYRGKRNEPAYVALVTAAIARIRNIAVENAASAIYRNTLSVFERI